MESLGVLLGQKVRQIGRGGEKETTKQSNWEGGEGGG